MSSWFPSVFGSSEPGPEAVAAAAAAEDGNNENKGSSAPQQPPPQTTATATAPPPPPPPPPIRPGFGGGDAWFLVGPLSSLPNITGSGETIISDPCPAAAAAAAANNLPSSGSSSSSPSPSPTPPPPRPSCKVLQVPRHDSTLALALPDSAILAAGEQDSAAAMLSYFDPSSLSLSSPSSSPSNTQTETPPAPQTTSEKRKAAAASLRDQVLVFRYRDTVHAIDNECPHSSYPLSNGSPFDIEDFGLKLSSGITCPKHGWSFDLFRGNGDRGNYRLKVWEVKVMGKGEGVPAARKGVSRGGGGGEMGKEGKRRGEEGKGGEEVNEDEDDLLVWVRRKQRMG